MRRPLLALIALLGTIPGLAAQQSGGAPSNRAFTTADVRLRHSPSANARVVVTLPRATLVTVGDCDGTWCGVAFRDLEGFAARRYLAFSHPVKLDDSASAQQSGKSSSSGRGYLNSRGEWIPSPHRTRDGKPPAGATAQCRDGTYSFSRSRRGTCSWHGGVARWL